MDVSLTMWVATVVVLVVLISVDFFVGARKPHEVSLREAGIWSAVWIALAGLFAGFLWWHSGSAPAGQFLAGWITEKSLSVDNLFVFVLIMAKFAVPRVLQQRVLMIGVLIALVLRAVFIAAGAAVIASFSWIFFLFGAFLIWTAWKLIKEARSGETGENDDEYEESRLLRAVERRLPTTDGYRGARLIVVEAGRRLVTPMLLVVLAIGTTDVLFAMDSIPAIFGLTQDAYIVFAANAFALMGLRQLYFLVGGLLERLVHLSYGLSVILGFIGVKLLLHALHEAGVHAPEIGTPLSLAVVVGVLAVTTVTSLVSARGTARASETEERTGGAQERSGAGQR
jgi:tellurite resistance protein TerC